MYDLISIILIYYSGFRKILLYKKIIFSIFALVLAAQTIAVCAPITDVSSGLLSKSADPDASFGTSSFDLFKTGSRSEEVVGHAVLKERLSILEFGADNTGLTDSTIALANAAAFIARNPKLFELVFVPGIYKYSISPNWAIQNAVVRAEGNVFLKYTGTGNAVIFDAGASVGTVFNVKFLGNFIVQAPSSALNGFFVRSIHHSIIEGRVDGCGSTSSALLINFAVATEFNIKSSNNEINGWYSSKPPLHGIFVTKRGEDELTTASFFNNPVIEGMAGDGIFLDYASKNIFVGGTSEGNAGLGLSLTSHAVRNQIIGIDLESNLGGSIQDAGAANTYNSVNATQLTTFTNAATYSRIVGGWFDSIIDNGTGSQFSGAAYGSNGGTFTGYGSLRSKKDIYNLQGGIDKDMAWDALVVPTSSIASATATTVITLPNIVSTMYQVSAYSKAKGANYVAYAIIYVDVGAANATIISKINGANLSITVSGLNVQITQTSGKTLDVYAAAKSI